MPEDMSEQEKKPGFYVQRRHEGASFHGVGKEQHKPSGETFLSIQAKLEQRNLSDDEVDALVSKRAKMVNEAKAVGLFKDAAMSVPAHLKGADWDDADKILIPLAENLESSAKRFYEKNPEWEGMVRTAVEGAIARIWVSGMELKMIQEKGLPEEWFKKKGYGDPEYRVQLGRDANLLKNIYPLVPPDPSVWFGKKEAQPASGVTQEEMTQNIRDLMSAVRQTTEMQRDIPQKIAEAMGVMPPGDNLRVYLEAEEYMLGFNIGPGNEPKFFPFVDVETQNEWKARGTLARMAAYKKAVPSFDKLFPNQDAIDMSKSEFKYLMEKKGVLEAVSLYSYMLANGKNPIEVFGIRGGYSDKLVSKLVSGGMEREVAVEYAENLGKRLRSCPENILGVKDGDQLKGLRAGMKYWLIMNRDLAVDISGRIPKDEARDAEQIAWNFVYSSNMIEEYDSRFSEVGGKREKRLPPLAGLKSLPTWMMVHPQERLEAKVKVEEAWSAFGEWALNKKRSIRARVIKIPPITRWTPEKEDILPKTLFKNVFEEIEDGQKRIFMRVFLKNGEIWAGDKPNGQVDLPDFGEGMSDAPFASYQFDKVNPAIMVFSVINVGQLKDKNLVDLGNSFRKLNVENKYRENLLKAWVGIRSTSRSLSPSRSRNDWWIFKRGLREYAPNFFK